MLRLLQKVRHRRRLCSRLLRERQKIRRRKIDILFLLFFLQLSHLHPADGPGSPLLPVVAEILPGVAVGPVASPLHQADKGALGNSHQQKDENDCEDKERADGPEGRAQEAAKRAAQDAASGPGLKELRRAGRFFRAGPAEQMDQGACRDQQEEHRRDLDQRARILLVRDPVDPR